MFIYKDIDGNMLDDPDLSAGSLTPLETVHHEAVPETSHTESKTLPGGMELTWKVVDTPAMAAWDEVAVYLYTPTPVQPTAEELAEGLAEVAGLAAENTAAVEDIYTALGELGQLIGGE